MTEKEGMTWKKCVDFFVRWRCVKLETEEQWDLFAKDTGKLAADLDIDHNPLGRNLFFGVLETFNDLYRGGEVPEPANYFGRDDL